MLAAGTRLVDVRPARDALDLPDGTLLHAGPPLDLDRISGPMLGALQGALVFEGLAVTPECAETMIRSGQVALDSCHHHRTVGPMAGVVSPSVLRYVRAVRSVGGVVLVLRSVRLCFPAEQVVEVAAVVRAAGRVRAVAARFEHTDRGWRCVVLRIL